MVSTWSQDSRTGRCRRRRQDPLDTPGQGAVFAKAH